MSGLGRGYPVTNAEFSAVMSEIQQDAPEDSRPVQQSAECQKAEDTDNELRGNLVDDLREVQACCFWFQIGVVARPGMFGDIS